MRRRSDSWYCLFVFIPPPISSHVASIPDRSQVISLSCLPSQASVAISDACHSLGIVTGVAGGTLPEICPMPEQQASHFLQS